MILCVTCASVLSAVLLCCLYSDLFMLLHVVLFTQNKLIMMMMLMQITHGTWILLGPNSQTLAIVLFLLLVRQSGTHCLKTCRIRSVLWTVTDSH